MDNYLSYVNANNLYECILSQKLPNKEIMWTDADIRTVEEQKEKN